MNSVPQNTASTKIVIDTKSGFCFGVSRAIRMAEEELNQAGRLYSLGQIVHNEQEIKRLKKRGLQITNSINNDSLKPHKILFRAHGEPPASYLKAKKQNTCIIDATCPVVLKLQQRVQKAWQQIKKENGQIIIYGKKDHAEIIGLSGQTNQEAIIIESIDDIINIHPDKTTILFSQTTMSYTGFEKIEKAIRRHLTNPEQLTPHCTICAQVGNRVPHLKKFAAKHTVILFVGGAKSSNGQFLFETCKSINHNSYYISSHKELDMSWFSSPPKSIGICGATSTPQWLMEDVAEKTATLLNQ